MRDRHPLAAASQTLTPGSAPPLTAAAASALIAGCTDLPEQQRRDLLSAINSLVRIARLPPDLVRMTPAALRATLLRRSAAECGLAHGSKANIESLLRRVLVLAGLADAETVPLADRWVAALDGLAGKARYGLFRLARFCSARQIAPAAVDADTFTAFRQYVEERVLVANPREVLKTARRAWNRACDASPAWPGRKLARRQRAHDYILPLTAFPAGFQADLAALGDRLAGTTFDDPFDLPDGMVDLGPPRPLKPSSIALRQDHCRWAASAVVASGVAIAEITSLASLVTPVRRAGDALRFLFQRAGDKPSPAGMHVAEALMIVAKYVARLPAGDIKRLQAWSKTVRLQQQGLSPKNARTMREALDPPRDEALRGLPDALLKAAVALRDSQPQRAAALAMRAVGVALLTRVPLRPANVLTLRFDRHLHRPDPQRDRIAAIYIPAEETKTGRSIDAAVSAELSILLNTWIRDFRPLIDQPGCPYLLPGGVRADKPITPQAFRDAIKDATREHAGVGLSPHQFRHLAAHRYLQENPGHYETVRQFLGHATTETALRYYAGTDQAAALQRLDEVVTRGRRTTGRNKRTRCAPAATGPRSRPRDGGSGGGRRGA